jgi:hypothetical protein
MPYGCLCSDGGNLVIFIAISLTALEAREDGSRGRLDRQIGSRAALGLEYLYRGYNPEPHRESLVDGSGYYGLDHSGAQAHNALARRLGEKDLGGVCCLYSPAA